MGWLIGCWSDPGDVILDPFAGSGTIPIEAAERGRTGIGIEIDAGYVEIARRRWALRPMRLPIGEPEDMDVDDAFVLESAERADGGAEIVELASRRKAG